MSRRLPVFSLLLFATQVFAQAKPPAAPPATAPASTTPKPADDPWVNRSDLFVAPPTAPMLKVQLGAVERYTLPNGLRVIAVARHQAPVIAVTLAVRLDEGADPLDKIGLSQFTASMLRKGTAKRTSDGLANEIDSVGGELNADSDDDATYVSCRARSRSLALCLDLVSDISLHPSFPEAELGEIRDQLSAGVESARDNPSQLAGEHAANLFFGDEDQRGLPVSKRSIQAIDRAALASFHGTWYVPNNSVLAVSGDFDPKALRGALTKWFGGWKAGTVPKKTARALPAAGPLKVRFIDKPDATQAQISIIGPGIKHADPDLFAVRLMNYTLGGGLFSSRLMKVVRSDNGKTYGASSRFDTHREPGTFHASTFTRAPETANTIKLVLGEITRMQKSGPSADELAAAKANMIGGYGLKFETADDVARQLLLADVDGLPADFAEKTPQHLAEVTLADAAQAAHAHLAPQGLVVVGNAKDVVPLLTAASLKPSEIISYTDPVSGAERKAIESSKKAAAAVSPAEAEAGRLLLALAVKAKGGDAYLKVADLHVNGGGSITAEGQNMHVGLEGYYQPGRAQREDMTMASQTVSQVLVDGKAFIVMNMSAKDLPAAPAKRDLWRNGNLVVLHATLPGAKVKALPQLVDGKKRYDVLVVVSPDGDATRVLLDPQTHLPAKLLYEEDGKPASVELSDYKTEAGVAIARHITSDSDGQHLELSLDKVQINKGLPAKTFAR